MKARPDLTPDSHVVKSSPNSFYTDPNGNVNEIENLEEQVLFGDIDNPRTDAEEKLWLQAEHDCRVACDPQLNPHLRAVNALLELLEGAGAGLEWPVAP